MKHWADPFLPDFKHYNSRGDVVAATDGTGALTYQAAYEAFARHGDTPSSEEWGSTADRQQGNTKDEDGWGALNEGHRYRLLNEGVFMTPDPLGFVDGPNVYTYVVQNPWTKFDPLGLEAYKPRFWTGRLLWSKANRYSLTTSFVNPEGGAGGITPFGSSSAPASGGMVGTSKAGFIDVGHVRHNMDRTLSFYQQLGKAIQDSPDGVVKAGAEYGSGLNPYTEVPNVTLGMDVSAKNIHEAAGALAQAEGVAYEEVTKNTPSGYSTEDLPSNQLGVDIAVAALSGKGLDYQPEHSDWSRAMDVGLKDFFDSSGAMTKQQSLDAFNTYGPDIFKSTKGRNMTTEPVLFTAPEIDDENE